MYSREELRNILNQGQAIKVGGINNYTPTEFLKEDDTIFYRNKELTSDKEWYKHPKNSNEILDHLENMQKEGFYIQIIPEKDYSKPIIENAKDNEENEIEQEEEI